MRGPLIKYSIFFFSSKTICYFEKCEHVMCLMIWFTVYVVTTRITICDEFWQLNAKCCVLVFAKTRYKVTYYILMLNKQYIRAIKQNRWWNNSAAKTINMS